MLRLGRQNRALEDSHEQVSLSEPPKLCIVSIKIHEISVIQTNQLQTL